MQGQTQTQNWSLIRSAVLTFIGYKKTKDKKTYRQAKYIHILL